MHGEKVNMNRNCCCIIFFLILNQLAIIAQTRLQHEEYGGKIYFYLQSDEGACLDTCVIDVKNRDYRIVKSGGIFCLYYVAAWGKHTDLSLWKRYLNIMIISASHARITQNRTKSEIQRGNCKVRIKIRQNKLNVILRFALFNSIKYIIPIDDIIHNQTIYMDSYAIL